MSVSRVFNINEGRSSMPSKNGFVMAWRDMKKQPWYSNPEHVAVFTHIMLSATSKPIQYSRKGAVCNLNAGEFVTTYDELGAQFNLDKSKVRRIIQTFIKHKQITKRLISVGGVNKGIVLSLTGWNKWQNKPNFSDTWSDTPADTSKPFTLKGLEVGGDTQPDTQPDTVLNNKVINNNIVPKGTCKNSVEFVPNPEPNVPHQEIINLFRKILPDLPQVKKLTDARRRSIKARHSGMFKKDLANWEKYFTYVKTNCTWMTSGSFSITFDYLIKQANVVAIMEGAKDDRH